MSLIKEDWERVYLTDEMYLKEKEWEEQEHFRTEKPPAKITMSRRAKKLLKRIKRKNKNEVRLVRRPLSRTD